MAGIRWRSVLPLSLLLLTLIAARNMFVYVTHLPQDGSSSFNFDVVDDDQRTQSAYRRHDRSGSTSGSAADADQRPETDSEERAPANSVERKPRSKKNSKLKAFELFPDDEPVAKSEQTEEEEQQLDRHIRRSELEEQAVRQGQSDEEDTKERGHRDLVVHERHGGEEVRKEDSAKEEKREMLKVADESRSDDLGAGVDAMHEKRFRLLNDSNANVALPEEDTLMMANMGEVGAIVRKMKDSSSGSGNESASSQPVKPHPFKYVINSPKICADDDIFVIVYVHTATDHYKRRTLIRQTWGDASQYDVIVRLVFVMGIVLEGDGQSAQNALRFEAEQYGDIVQEDFVDTYHNLTHKGVAALKWIATHCQQATYVLKTDDDIFVNMYTLIKYLKRTPRVAAAPRGVLMCLVWDSMPVLREGKWKVTKEEWPEDSYPTYCSGSAFVMSTDVAISMYRVSYDVPFFWIDDFYITGLLPLKLGNVTHRQFASAYVLNGDKLESAFTGSRWFTYVFSHVHNLDRIQSVWETLTQLVNGQIVPTIQSRTALPKSLQQRNVR